MAETQAADTPVADAIDAPQDNPGTGDDLGASEWSGIFSAAGKDTTTEEAAPAAEKPEPETAQDNQAGNTGKSEETYFIDSEGVRYKTREDAERGFLEKQRTLSRYQSEAAVAKQRAEQLDRELSNLKQAPAVTGPTDKELQEKAEAGDVEAQAELNKRAREAFKQEIRSEFQSEKQAEESRRQSNEQLGVLMKEFPDLTKEDSALHKTVKGILDERPFLKTVDGLRTATDLAVARMAASGLIKEEQRIADETVEKLNKGAAVQGVKPSQAAAAKSGAGWTSQQVEAAKIFGKNNISVTEDHFKGGFDV